LAVGLLQESNRFAMVLALRVLAQACAKDDIRCSGWQHAPGPGGQRRSVVLIIKTKVKRAVVLE
jgi:hypothetical protein